ncbi:hypothetical protein [Jannaschia sp. R86511]|uniref:hypothetical protein n=1 Tax=Jannaschia sp. R86511 TaxID=3093853 RepID=UPI0036D3B9A8
MALTKTSAWSLGTLGLCVALSAGAWFLAIEPERAEAADTREQTVAAEQSNAQLEVRIEQLRQEYADLPTRQAELAAIRQALPDEPALAGLIRAVNESADDVDIVLSSITTGAVSAVVDPNAVTEVTDEGAEAGAEASAEPSAEPSTEASAEPADAAAGVTVVEGAPAGAVLAAVPITIDTRGGFFETNLFLKALQADISRAVLVDGLTITAIDEEDVDPGTVTTSITARVFVFVDPDSVDSIDAPVPATD